MNSGLIFEDQELQELLPPFVLPSKKKLPLGVKKKKVILIAGPTGVGKTALSLVIAQAVGGEVISADSMQVYRGMDIGTAKVGLKERNEVPHHLIDSRDLDEVANVVEFYHEAIQAIHEILAKGHVPIVVGGTGFYLHALIYGPPKGPPSQPRVRECLEQQIEERGSLTLYQELAALDPEYAKTITPQDRHKIIRALEIMTITGSPVSQFAQDKEEVNEEFDFRCWFLYVPKERLHPIIEARCEQMVKAGLLEEVKVLKEEGLEANSSASSAIGYRQALSFLRSDQTEEDFKNFITDFKRASRALAKRQYTWFRKEPLFRWLDVDAIDREMALEMIIQDYEFSF